MNYINLLVSLAKSVVVLIAFYFISPVLSAIWLALCVAQYVIDGWYMKREQALWNDFITKAKEVEYAQDEWGGHA